MRRSAVAVGALSGLVAVLATLSGADAVAPPPKPPAFVSYAPPPGMGETLGEPTIGVDPRNGVVLLQSYVTTMRVTRFDGHGYATWTDVSPPETSEHGSYDPILETDPATGRTFVSHLQLACSFLSYTDDDGANWVPVPLGCAPGAMYDHQSVGVGAFRGPHTGSYPSVVYYCANATLVASCGTSTDGGATFGPGLPAYTNNQCSVGFGMLKSAPDGTAYLPPRYCGTLEAGVVRTTDQGTTWTVHPVPGSWRIGDAMDSSVGVGTDGTVFFGWGGSHAPGPGGPPYVAVSRDSADTWTAPVRLGTEYGIVNTRFVTTVAGDGDRAAVAFLGSPTPGDGSAPGFTGEWHLYVSFTYDRGKTWSTVDATPGAPLQVGAICVSGIACTQDRNLLDFNDVVVDPRGFVLVAFTDGCPDTTCTATTRKVKATIARQESGRGLYRRYDPVVARRPGRR